MTDSALVGASVEAIVGTMTTGRWNSSETAFAVSSVFPPPTPMTNFTPASLVNAVQVLYREWNYKPAGIISYGGISGGLRASQTLRELLGNVNVMALPQVVPVPFFPEFINDESVFTPNDKMSEGTTQLLGELTKWATALKTMRG